MPRPLVRGIVFCASLVGSFIAGGMVSRSGVWERVQDARVFGGGEPGRSAQRGSPTVQRAASDTTRAVTPIVAQPSGRGRLETETAAALQARTVTDKYFALMSILERLTRDNWRDVLKAFAEERKLTGLAHPEAFEVFVRRAGEVAGREAVNYFLERRDTKHANDALMGWASKHPAEALQWLGRETDADTRRNVMGAAIRGLALSEPDLAIKTLEGLPAKERGGHTGELVTSMLRAAGIDRTQELVEGMIARAGDAGALREAYVANVFSDYAFLRIRQSAANGTISETIDWLNQHVGQPYVDHRVIAEATARLAGQNPRETFRWLEQVNTTLLRAGDESTAGYRVLLQTWTSQEGAPAVESWLHSQTSHPHYDHMAYQYTALLGASDPAKAAQWANSIKSEALKRSALDLIRSKAPKKTS